MAWDLGDALDVVRSLADWAQLSPGEHGPARKRVGRWTGRVFLGVIALTAIAALIVWLKSESTAAFDQNGLPVVVLGLLALIALAVVHCIAALIANRIDRRAKSSYEPDPPSS